MSGFRLWEIDQMLRDAVGAAEGTIGEDGVIPDDWAAFLDDVQMERDKKCLAVAAVHKELSAEAEAVAAEAKALIARSRSAQAKADRLKSYLGRYMQPGERLQDTRCLISWRKSKSVVIDDESGLPESCFRVVREISKTEIKAALESGADIPAHIEERQNIQIK